ncbi:M15 family metallopeptidase [Prochlorococcus marinus]|uniref:M15 family metallopeptidase n=1 Tax=Prochlorococcus marinus TaxID=1219 RepID=UPI0022B42C73|nr:M15 family metallopeptidase [Prochlorococcus marinus]
MTKLGGPGGSTNDEIPLARRSQSLRRVSSKWLRSFLFGFIFLTVFSVFLTYKYLSFQKSSQPFQENELIGSSSFDGLLLGHFPYPEASLTDLVTAYPGLLVHRDTYKALSKMSSAAAAEGIQLVLLSGYRSIDLQRDIFYENKSVRNQIAIERAEVSAPPGYSEHSTGYAIDLGDGTMRYTDFEVEFENTPAFVWLQRNAARFHFVLSFPKGNSQGVSYEPWHWRFEGTVEALEQFEPANKRMRIEKNSKSK